MTHAYVAPSTFAPSQPLEQAERRVLLVEFPSTGTDPFKWLEMCVPNLRADSSSLTKAASRSLQHDYEFVFIDITEDTSPLEWSLIQELVAHQQARTPAPVVVPVVASGAALSKMRSALCPSAPVYLTRPINLQDLLQVVKAFGREP